MKYKYYSIFLLTLFSCTTTPKKESEGRYQSNSLKQSNVIVETDQGEFRDLNHNGKLDIYEDIKQPVDARVENLLSQMKLDEKAGMMFIDGAPVNVDGSLEGKIGITGPATRRPPAIDNIKNSKMNHFNLWDIPSPDLLAGWYNKLQQFAETTRLGIPITIASDPRHHFSQSIFSLEAKGFSQFCEMLGFAAIGDDDLMMTFGDIVRQEYLAVGIRLALHPQIDLATEPRWARINGGFGEDAQLTAKLAKGYIIGLQGESLNEVGVACMTKHFPGGGPQKEGLDPHFEFNKGQVYPGDNFDYHLIPFEEAMNAGTAAIMPYYGVPMKQTDEDVAMAYNKSIITGLLRERYKYDGVVCTDWGLITDVPIPNTDVIWPARAWGVEHLNEKERVKKIIDAGCDQFGGESRDDLVVELVNEGAILESRIDQSVRRLLRQKFELGLFDNPFIDTTLVNDILGKPEFQALGANTQQRAMTLLKNDGEILPLSSDIKVYPVNIADTIVSQYAQVVANPADADVAIIRIKTPWYPVDSENPLARAFHHGDLDFKGAEKEEILTLLEQVPTVVDIYLDRPAVIPEIVNKAGAVIANYGASDKSVCEVLFGNSSPQGRLPFELPSSMKSVENQMADVPYDSENPLFEFGFGLNYSSNK